MVEDAVAAATLLYNNMWNVDGAKHFLISNGCQPSTSGIRVPFSLRGTLLHIMVTEQKAHNMNMCAPWMCGNSFALFE